MGRPLPNGLFMACKGGDPNYLLHGMILQVVTTGFFLPFLVTTTRKNWKIWFFRLEDPILFIQFATEKNGGPGKTRAPPNLRAVASVEATRVCRILWGETKFYYQSHRLTLVIESFAPNWELRTAKKTRHGGVLGREFHEMISVAYHPIRQHVWYSWILIPNWKKHDTPEI